MKKNYFILAAAAVTLGFASCADNDYVNGNTLEENAGNGEITFGVSKGVTSRGDIYGVDAASLLGNKFVVEGVKGTEDETALPSTGVAFDNYYVFYEQNTAGTTASNTHNWEYVDKSHAVIAPANDPSTTIGRTVDQQTIKYWDYSTDQYSFIAYSTGSKEMVAGATEASAGNVKVTKIDPVNAATKAYEFTGVSVEDLSNCYITDVTEVEKEKYGQVVTLKFKNITSKVRVAFYETIPGYSVSNLEFYQDETTKLNADISANTSATLFADGSTIPQSGTISVYYPHIGTKYAPTGTNEADYNKPTVTTTAGDVKTSKLAWGTVNYTAAEHNEPTGNLYLERSLPKANYAGSLDAKYYTPVLPNSAGQTLTLRVNYTLTSTDGSKETIKVYGAKAVVPVTYTKWQSNYAYTYVFKISDNTNGWTSTADAATNTDPAGLFPITFDAVVAEMTDANAEQTTITTVATPSITTYQQKHKEGVGNTNYPNEYDNDNGNIYVQVMNNSTAPATLVGTLSNTNSLLYSLNDENATEAKVMDALNLRTSELTAADVTGRNGLTMTKVTSGVSSEVTSIVNGVNDDPITVTKGQATEINPTSLAAGTYAYVYDYTTGDKTAVNQYQPIATEKDVTAVTGKYSLAATSITTKVTDAAETASEDYIYFSMTTNGTATTTYSYVTVENGKTLVNGLYKVAKTTLAKVETADAKAAAGTFYFDVYVENNGKYAVKVIKIVD